MIQAWTISAGLATRAATFRVELVQGHHSSPVGAKSVGLRQLNSSFHIFGPSKDAKANIMETSDKAPPQHLFCPKMTPSGHAASGESEEEVTLVAVVAADNTPADPLAPPVIPDPPAPDPLDSPTGGGGDTGSAGGEATPVGEYEYEYEHEREGGGGVEEDLVGDYAWSARRLEKRSAPTIQNFQDVFTKKMRKQKS